MHQYHSLRPLLMVYLVEVKLTQQIYSGIDGKLKSKVCRSVLGIRTEAPQNVCPESGGCASPQASSAHGKETGILKVFTDLSTRHSTKPVPGL